MNPHTSVEVKVWSTGLVTVILDGESQTSKEVTDYIVQKDAFLGYPCCCSSDSGAVIWPFNCAIQHTPPVIHEEKKLESIWTL